MNNFMQKYTIININCQHNRYLESIKMSIIGRKLAKKHNEQIMKHNRLNPRRDVVCPNLVQNNPGHDFVLLKMKLVYCTVGPKLVRIPR